MNKVYDLHVATDAGGTSAELHQQLLQHGFVDDALIQRGLRFGASTSAYYSSCPFIDVHMSRKFQTLQELRRVEPAIDSLLRNSGCAGYWHSEFTEFDLSVLGSPQGHRLLSLPFEPLEVLPRPQNKTWDLHVAMLSSSIPEGFTNLLLSHGFYSIERRKPKGAVTVWTLQGVNKIEDGRLFAQRLFWWLGCLGLSAFDFKFELTLSMQKVNNPSLVPPTVVSVNWR